MAGFSTEVGDYLRDFSYTPTNKADDSQSERDLIIEVAETILEIVVNPPPNTWLILFKTV